MGQQHRYDAEVHGHEHAHMTHYLSDGQDWTHLTATHRHQHNHAALAARVFPDFSEPPGKRGNLTQP
jgi:hypothetical protein